METPIEDIKAVLKDEIEAARPGRYIAAIEAAKVREDNDQEVNKRNLAQAKEELAFYQHLQHVIDGGSLADEHTDRVKAILEEYVEDEESVIKRLQDAE